MEEIAERYRCVFQVCFTDLCNKTEFDVMYRELNNTEIGKNRMTKIFILRADTDAAYERSAQELYNGIAGENNDYFIQWFNAIKDVLDRTGNEKNGEHADLSERISTLKHDGGLGKENTRTRNHLSMNQQSINPAIDVQSRASYHVSTESVHLHSKHRSQPVVPVSSASKTCQLKPRLKPLKLCSDLEVS